ncbi:MAG: protein kinase, partial [Ktedonobacteraceae bacterium]
MQSHDLTGQVLGHYRIKRPVGYGGMATVFLAEDINLRRDIAVKVFEPSGSDSTDFFRRFEREAQVLAQLDHPNILPVYDFGQQNDIAYLITPYITGGSLRELLHARGTLSVPETVRLMSQILNALQYAHDRGLIHRDIKPGNMLLKQDGTILLSDFGLVKIVSSGSLTGMESLATLTGHMIAGTPDYMAPEQIAAQTMPASDIYSVGVVIYEMLTGAHLFTASDSSMGILMKHLYEQPRPLREVNPNVSPQLNAVVMRALEKDPANRYHSPTEFLQALIAATSTMRTADAMDTASPTIANTWQQQVLPPPIQSHPPLSTPLTPYHMSNASEKTGYEPVSHPSTPNPTTPVPLVPMYVPASMPFTPGSGPAIPYAATAPAQQQPYATVQMPVKPAQSHRPIVFAAIIAVLIVLIAGISIPLFASGLFGPHNNQPGGITHGQTAPPHNITVTAGAKGSKVTPVVTNTAGQMYTTCPSAGTARAAVMPTYTPGNHPNIIYVVNEGTINAPTYGTVKRHDIITGNSTEIIKTPNTRIVEAQVSYNGQWVLYNAIIAGQDELRLIRVDGQDAQTLLCAPAGQNVFSSQWSANEQFVIFDQGTQTGVPAAYLLDLTNGSLQKELIPAGNQGYLPRTWLDHTHVVLTGFVPSSAATPQGLYLLNISNGANQPDSSLQQIASTTSCWNFDTGFDTSTIFTSQCTGDPVFHSGTSTVVKQSINGGPSTTIYSDPNVAVTTIRDITPTKLLLLVENAGPSNSTDTSQNGLWIINTDGTNLTRLTTDTDNSQALCPFSQYFWSNVTHDGSMYALQGFNPNTNEYKLLF